MPAVPDLDELRTSIDAALERDDPTAALYAIYPVAHAIAVEQGEGFRDLVNSLPESLWHDDIVITSALGSSYRSAGSPRGAAALAYFQAAEKAIAASHGPDPRLLHHRRPDRPRGSVAHPGQARRCPRQARRRAPDAGGRTQRTELRAPLGPPCAGARHRAAAPRTPRRRAASARVRPRPLGGAPDALRAHRMPVDPRPRLLLRRRSDGDRPADRRGLRGGGPRARHAQRFRGPGLCCRDPRRHRPSRRQPPARPRREHGRGRIPHRLGALRLRRRCLLEVAVEGADRGARPAPPGAPGFREVEARRHRHRHLQPAARRRAELASTAARRRSRSCPRSTRTSTTRSAPSGSWPGSPCSTAT